MAVPVHAGRVSARLLALTDALEEGMSRVEAARLAGMTGRTPGSIAP